MEKLGEEEDEEEEPATKRRREYTDLGLDLDEREEQVVCHASALALAMRRSTSGSGDISLTIYVTSVSGCESLTSFANRFIHFSGPPGFRMTFDTAERNGRFGRIRCQRSKESSSIGKRKRRVILCRRTVRVKVIGKSSLGAF